MIPTEGLFIHFLSKWQIGGKPVCPIYRLNQSRQQIQSRALYAGYNCFFKVNPLPPGKVGVSHRYYLKNEYGQVSIRLEGPVEKGTQIFDEILIPQLESIYESQPIITGTDEVLFELPEVYPGEPAASELEPHGEVFMVKWICDFSLSRIKS